MNPALALPLTPPALEQRGLAASPHHARTGHGVDAVHMFAADISDLDPRWGA
jgi:hypothetical protein